MDLVNYNYFIWGPLFTVLILYVFNVYIFFEKYNSNLSWKKDMQKIIVIFIFILALLLQVLIYSIIVLKRLNEVENLTLSEGQIYNFLILIYSTIFLQFFVVRIYFAKLANTDLWKILVKFVMSLIISEIPSIVALVYIFSLIGK